MAAILIENKKVFLTVVLKDYFGDEDLRGYLKEYLPGAKCDLAVSMSGESGSWEEYEMMIDTVQEPVLLLTLRDFCKRNNLTHQIDIAD